MPWCTRVVRGIFFSGRINVGNYSGTKYVCVCFIGVHEGIQRIESKCNGNCVWLLLIKFSMGQALYLVIVYSFATAATTYSATIIAATATFIYLSSSSSSSFYFSTVERLCVYKMGCLALISPCFGCHHDLPLIINAASDSCDLNYLMCSVESITIAKHTERTRERKREWAGAKNRVPEQSLCALISVYFFLRCVLLYIAMVTVSSIGMRSGNRFELREEMLGWLVGWLTRPFLHTLFVFIFCWLT